MSNLKKYFITIAIFLLFTSCSKKHFITILKTESTNTHLRDSSFVFENDTIKITYNFWCNRGLLSYSIYNKLAVPLYIDWKKSSYIVNENKLNYWVDKEQTNVVSYYQGLGYRGPLLAPGYTATTSVGVSSISKYKEERITFIPPKSYIYRSSFYLVDKLYTFPEPTSYNEVENNYDYSKKAKKEYIGKEIFNKTNSPFTFRNFLSISTNEKFDTEFYVDNDFWVTGLQKMNSKQFIEDDIYINVYLTLNLKTKNYTENKYKKPNLFFIYK